MSYFHKHWSDLVSEVEDAIQRRVSLCLPSIKFNSFILFQFTDRFYSLYKERDLSTESTHKGNLGKKASSPHKSSPHHNFDDTTEDESDDDDAAASKPNACMDEYRLYLTTNEVIPEGMGIVRWWGVSTVHLFHLRCLLTLLYSS
jgi:hypothetical protein